MKKVFAIAAIAGLMVACNNSSEKKVDVADSTTKMMEEADKMMDTAAQKMDNMMDTAAKKMDNIVDTATKKMEEAKTKM